MLVIRPVLVESLYWTAFHVTRVRTISAFSVILGKLPLTMSRVSYGTLLSGILTCNSETKSSILTKFSESKWSSMDNMLAKFRCLEIVAMETVTFFFFEWPISQLRVKVLSWNFGNACSWTKGTFYGNNTISWELQIFFTIKKNSSQGPVDVKFHMGHWFRLFWFITPKREIGFSQNFQQVGAQAWKRCLQNFVVRKLLLWKR